LPLTPAGGNDSPRTPSIGFAARIDKMVNAGREVIGDSKGREPFGGLRRRALPGAWGKAPGLASVTILKNMNMFFKIKFNGSHVL